MTTKPKTLYSEDIDEVFKTLKTLDPKGFLVFVRNTKKPEAVLMARGQAEVDAMKAWYDQQDGLEEER